jgi:hypothetical protein
MALNASERELIADVIGSVRAVAAQVISLHLQLGAIRSLLVKKGTMTEAEYAAAVTALEVTSAADAILSRDAPAVDVTFDELLRRLEGLI